MIAEGWQIFFTLGTGLTALVGNVLGLFFSQYFNWLDTARAAFCPEN